MKTTIHAALLAASTLVSTSATFAQNYGYPVNAAPGYCPNGQCQAAGYNGIYPGGQSPGLTPVTAPFAGSQWNQYTGAPGNMNPAGNFGAGHVPARNRQPQHNPSQFPNVPVINANYTTNYGGNYGGALNIPRGMEGIAQLPYQEQVAALQQRICPVSGHALGSMGRPVLVNLNGRNVYVCCEDCARSAGYTTGSLWNYGSGGIGGLIPVGPAPGYQPQANLNLY